MFAAVLDTNVLWPSLQRDYLLTMAALGLYRPLWSEAILEELHEHETLKLIKRGASPERAAARAEHLIGQMRRHFDDALVTGWEPLEGSFGLKDVDDEHVVAAAVVGGAGVIVTDNLPDFPAEKMPAHIDVHDAKTFAANTATVDPQLAVRALTETATRHHSPETPSDILDALVNIYQMTDLDGLLRPLLTTG
ncbi:MAG: PIN domain-containing protein [Aeromicrobium sp.]|uniref:PIN domain-containing protein n=1 Tax=Aeromicrobium sp. TaxID=1871063 RepID=UPI0039E409D6